MIGTKRKTGGHVINLCSLGFMEGLKPEVWDNLQMDSEVPSLPLVDVLPGSSIQGEPRLPICSGHIPWQ